jgi:hypothetical protein
MNTSCALPSLATGEHEGPTSSGALHLISTGAAQVSGGEVGQGRSSGPFGQPGMYCMRISGALLPRSPQGNKLRHARSSATHPPSPHLRCGYGALLLLPLPLLRAVLPIPRYRRQCRQPAAPQHAAAAVASGLWWLVGSRSRSAVVRGGVHGVHGRRRRPRPPGPRGDAGSAVVMGMMHDA